MRSALSIVFVGLSSLALVACGGSGPGDRFSGGSGGNGGVGGMLDCTTLAVPPADCQKACTSDTQCEASFCSNGFCLALCTAEQGCPTGSSCNVSGRCVPDVGTGGTGGGGNTGGSACQSIEVTPTRSIPNVMFLVDQSGSMDVGFGGGENRWEAAHTVINGIVSGIDSIVRFGLSTYASRDGNQNAPCPRIPTRIDFDLGNSDDIGDDSLYPYKYPKDNTHPTYGGEDTPTGDSIDDLVASIGVSPPPNEGPTIIVLATDGAPDSCEYPDPEDDSLEEAFSRNEAVTAAGNAHDNGIDVFVLWVGSLSDTGIEDHLQEVANEGVGLAADGSGGDAPFWVGTNPQDLENQFNAIISASISCDVTMDERFTNIPKACAEGIVTLNENPLSCPGGDWQVKPGTDNVIELLGDACAEFKSGSATFSAVFPCGTVVVVVE